MRNRYIIFTCILLNALGMSCKKLIEVTPPDTITTRAVIYSTDAGAFSAVRAIYSTMMNTESGMTNGYAGISFIAGISADELKIPISPFTFFPDYYRNEIISTRKYFWNELYDNAYVCNAAMEGCRSSTGMSAAAKEQLTGEAAFMRGFLYFYTVNLFGDAPVALTTDYRINNKLSRVAAAEIYAQIIQDLKMAESKLGDEYLARIGEPMADRIVPNRYAATALLSRVYLYTHDWQNATAAATKVIQFPAYSLEADPAKVFLKFSHEAIWQMQSPVKNVNTWDAQVFILRPGNPPSISQASISPFLLNAFESGDNRFQKWVGRSNVPASGTTPAATYYFPYKYKAYNQAAITECQVILRLAEQYLIRAEARVQMNDLTGAAEDLNVIRNRAGLPNTTASDKASLLKAILHERQVELFTEWGHRWLDLKRTGNIDEVMTIVAPTKGAVWKSTAQLFPIPSGELLLNSNLKQNPGY